MALIFVLGVLAFAIIPGMQIRVVTAAGAAPTLAVAVDVSGFQLAAACAGRIGGWAIDDGPGLRSIYPNSRCPYGIGIRDRAAHAAA